MKQGHNALRKSWKSLQLTISPGTAEEKADGGRETKGSCMVEAEGFCWVTRKKTDLERCYQDERLKSQAASLDFI